MPKLTIITINKNDVRGIERTLASIWKRQTFNDLEHIVIDGGSSDGSVDVIKQYEQYLAYWVSEPDRGIYNAMNKGIAKAKGDYLLFLNSGDWLEDDVLIHAFGEEFFEDIVYANLYHYRKDGVVEMGVYPEKLTVPFILTHSLGHPSTFIKRELFANMLYDEKYRIISDWVFFVKQILLHNCSTRYLNIAVSYFNDYGVSSDPKNKELIIREQTDFFENGFPCLISGFYQEYISLQEKMQLQKQALDIMSKRKTQQLLDSTWIQRKARQYIKLLFYIKKIFRVAS